MEIKKIMLVIIIICIIIIGAIALYTMQNNPNNNNTTITNNTTNNTSNTNITSNKTVESSDNSAVGSSESEPKYGSDSYVEKWDKSQRGDGNWAYTHDQPVKTDSQGNKYSRVYHEDTGKSSWEPTGPRKNK